MILNWQKVDNERIYIRKLVDEAEWLQKSYAITNESWQNLQSENAKLRKVADAAREMLEVIELLHPNMNPDEPCVCYEAWVRGKQALAELDGKDINVPSKEGER